MNPMFVPQNIYSELTGNIHYVDWREIIYQMALDYFAAQGCSAENPIRSFDGSRVVLDNPDQFLPKVAELNPVYYPTGITGYEQYYTDMQGFWRQLYNPEYVPEPVYELGAYYQTFQRVGEAGGVYKKITAWKDSSVVDFNIDYYTVSRQTEGNPIENLIYNQLQIYQTELNILDNKDELTQEEEKRKGILIALVAKYNKYKLDYSAAILDTTDMQNRKYWNINVFEAPETLNFWIDFLESDYELAQFSVPMIGDRAKVVNEDKASAIIFKDIPHLIFMATSTINGKGLLGNGDPDFDIITYNRQMSSQTGYIKVTYPSGMDQLFTISSRYLSVKDKIDSLLYDFAYCAENISLTSIPIYFLDPNTRIYVHDKTTNINGEYIVSKITLPLAYNGTMSVTASKAPERLY